MAAAAAAANRAPSALPVALYVPLPLCTPAQDKARHMLSDGRGYRKLKSHIEVTTAELKPTELIVDRRSIGRHTLPGNLNHARPNVYATWQPFFGFSEKIYILVAGRGAGDLPTACLYRCMALCSYVCRP